MIEVLDDVGGVADELFAEMPAITLGIPQIFIYVACLGISEIPTWRSLFVAKNDVLVPSTAVLDQEFALLFRGSDEERVSRVPNPRDSMRRFILD